MTTTSNLISLDIEKEITLTYQNTKDFLYRYEKHINQSRYRIKLEQLKIDMWGTIPSSPTYLEYLYNLLCYHKISKDQAVWDLGCGYSPILLFLRYFGYKNLFGIEYQKFICEKFGLEFNSKDENHHHWIFQGNLLDLPNRLKELISGAKVLYSFWPICNEEKYLDMIFEMSRLVKVGTIIVDYKGSLGRILDSETGYEKVYCGCDNNLEILSDSGAYMKIK